MKKEIISLSELNMFEKKLQAALTNEDPKMVRFIVSEIAELLQSLRQENVAKLHKFLDGYRNDSLTSGALHGAYFMICGHRRAHEENVKYFGLGCVRDAKEPLDKINYYNQHSFKYALIGGKDIELRKEWIRKNGELLKEYYERNDTLSIRNIVLTMEQENQNPLISFDSKEIKNVLVFQGNKFFRGAASSLYVLVTGNKWGPVMTSEFGGLGLVLDWSTNGANLRFSQKQMQHSKTGLLRALMLEDSFKHATFTIEKFEIPLEQLGEHIPLKLLNDETPIVEEVYFYGQNGGRHKSLGEYDHNYN